MPDIIIDPQDVIDQWGENYINEGQNMDNLHMVPFEEYGTQTAFTTVETDQTVLREANVEVQEILQGYQDDFTPKGGVAFYPVEIFLYQMKIDVAFNPNKLVKSWLGFLTKNNHTQEDWPFTNWLVEKYLMQQYREDLEMKGVYPGQYVIPTPGIAGPANEVMNGINKLFVDFDTAGTMGVSNMGAIPNTPALFVTQIENFIKYEVPEKYRHTLQMELNMSRTLRDYYKQGMRDKYNVQYQQTDRLLQPMDYENITIVGRASHMNTQHYWMTPKYNALFPVKGFTDKQAFQFEKIDRKVKIWADWWLGLGFINTELIWTNDLFLD